MIHAVADDAVGVGLAHPLAHGVDLVAGGTDDAGGLDHAPARVVAEGGGAVGGGVAGGVLGEAARVGTGDLGQAVAARLGGVGLAAGADDLLGAVANQIGMLNLLRQTKMTKS